MRTLERLVHDAHVYGPRPPFSAIPDLQVCIIAAALRMAWKALLSNPQHWRANLKGDREDFISDPLLRMLNFLRQNAKDNAFAGLRAHFHPVTQNSSYRSVSGNSLKSPDLIFTPKNCPYVGSLDAEYYAYFVEAKIIDTHLPQRKTVQLYCVDGLARFLNGNYAWAMPHAMLLAYVRDGQEPTAVWKYLESRQAKFACTTKACWRKPPNPESEVLVTNHSRDFRYPDKSVAGPIELHHLWLKT